VLRAMGRVLETGLRKFLNGHEGGNAGYSQGVSFELVAPALDPTRTLDSVCDECNHFFSRELELAIELSLKHRLLDLLASIFLAGGLRSFIRSRLTNSWMEFCCISRNNLR